MRLGIKRRRVQVKDQRGELGDRFGVFRGERGRETREFHCVPFILWIRRNDFEFVQANPKRLLVNPLVNLHCYEPDSLIRRKSLIFSEHG